MTAGERIEIRAARPGEAAVCEEILRSLPGWFGIEKAIVSYRADVENMETLVAVSAGVVAGKSRGWDSGRRQCRGSRGRTSDELTPVERIHFFLPSALCPRPALDGSSTIPDTGCDMLDAIRGNHFGAIRVLYGSAATK